MKKNRASLGYCHLHRSVLNCELAEYKCRVANVYARSRARFVWELSWEDEKGHLDNFGIALQQEKIWLDL
jgi:hypothetical protein